MGARHPLLRTLFHVLGAVIPLTYIAWGRGAALGLATAVFVLMAACEALRLTGILAPPVLKGQLKEKEARRPTGALFYAGSCLLAILIFEKWIAVASIFVLIVSDPLSSLIGSRWGRRKLLGKTLEGTAVFFVSAAVVIACFHFGAAAAIAGACAGTAADCFRGGRWTIISPSPWRVGLRCGRCINIC